MGKKQSIFLGSIIAIVTLIAPFFVVESAQRPYVRIEKGASRTDTREVTLYLLGPENVADMRISNDGVFDDEPWETYRSRKTWLLDYGRGTKRVYVQYRDQKGNRDRTTYQDTIFLSIPEDMDVDMEIANNDEQTSSRYVTLNLTYSDGVEEVRVSERKDFSDAEWYDVKETIPYILSSKSGTKTVYVAFLDGNNKTKVVSDTIVYREPEGTIRDRSVLLGQGQDLFYHGVDGKLHVFSDSVTYHSWYSDFSQVIPVSNKKVGQYLIGEPVCMRAGTWLVKFGPDPRVFAVEPGCALRPIYSPIEAYVLYGPGWDRRIHTLPYLSVSAYHIVDPRTAYDDDDVIDRDKDGVPKTVEDEYGTRDDRVDTDADGISDYEEIYYWFTDPRDSDTDDDGFSDGREILAGYSPLGTNRLSRVPDNTYQYARGSIVKRPGRDELYYVNNSYTYQYIGRDAGVREFTTNNFQARFIITPPYDMTLRPTNSRLIERNEELIKWPTTNGTNNNILAL